MAKNFRFSLRSLNNLKGVNPDLVKVVHKALELSEIDFVVTEGLRTIERQRELVAKGASQTMNSNHLTGNAVDVAAWVDGTVSWDHNYYVVISKAFKAASNELHTPITWGGDWKGFVDAVHFELKK